MNARTLFFSTVLIFTLIGCNSDEDFAVALHGKEKLSEGTVVPFFLEQNYPNPFNPSTTIRYGVNTSLHLRLRVLTEDWVEVTTLVDGVPVPGAYQIIFDARDYASGVYYYIMEGGGYTEIRAMRVVK